MLEITGMFAIAVVLTGSVLVALFVGEALIKWTIAVMSFGMRRADEAMARQSGQAQPVRILNGQRPRLQRI
jgi:hypothetical protein